MKYSPNVLELFAGAGGMSLGLEMAGFKSLLLNEIDADACRTLKTNRPNWIVCQRDIREISFEEYEWEVDLLAGGFPCQSFSYAGKGMGFDDVRGTLFYEFARAIKECKPRMFVAENVRGIIKHDGGNTFQTVLRTFDELGYTMLNTGVLNASDYGVPQNRERVFLVGVSNEYKHRVSWSPPKAHETQMTLWDALHAGVMYRKDVPDSVGDSYSEAKKKVMSCPRWWMLERLTCGHSKKLHEEQLLQQRRQDGDSKETVLVQTVTNIDYISFSKADGALSSRRDSSTHN